MLAQHGLISAEVVPINTPEAWRAFRRLGARRYAIVGSDARRNAIDTAVVWTSERPQAKVDVRYSISKGAGLHVGGDVLQPPGTTFIAIPLINCITVQDVGISLAAEVDAAAACLGLDDGDGDATACLYLKVALLELVTRYPEDPRSMYWTGVCPADHFDTDFMACWDEVEDAARIASASMSWNRCRARREGWEAERVALVDAGVVTAVTEQQFRWASLVVQTRAVRPLLPATPNSKPNAKKEEAGVTGDETSEEDNDAEEDAEEKAGPAMLCPILDLANHESTAPTGTIRLDTVAVNSPSGGNDADDSGGGGGGNGAAAATTAGTGTMQVVKLVSNFGLAVGSEITTCYNEDYDYLDLYETYGFFDPTAVIHTVEVRAPRIDPVLSGGGSLGMELKLKSRLVEMQQAIGYDPEYQAWWIPSESVSRSPLWCAVRATLLCRHDLPATEGGDAEVGKRVMQALMQPIFREAEVQQFLKKLLEAQLGRYAAAAVAFASTRRGGGGGGGAGGAHGGNGADAKISSSMRLIEFEQNILRGHVDAL